MFEDGTKLNDALIHMNTFIDRASGNTVATMRKHSQQKGNLPRRKVYENVKGIIGQPFVCYYCIGRVGLPGFWDVTQEID